MSASDLWRVFNRIEAGYTMQLTQALAHFLWQGCAIAIVSAVVARFLRQAAANARYVAGVIALLLMAACLPVTLLVLPSPRTLAVDGATQPVAVSMPKTPSPRAGETAVDVVAWDPVPTALSTSDAWPNRSALVPVSTTAASDGVAAGLFARDRVAMFLTSAAPYTSGLYLCGVVLMLLRVALGLWGGRRLRHACRPVIDGPILGMLRDRARRVGMRAVPVIAYCGRVSVPVVVGVLRPMILMPASLASGLTLRQLEAVLLHELAHIRRFDPAVNVLQRLVEAMLFFHPAVWWISRRIGAERENACDDLVLGSNCGRTEYADALVRMAELCAARGAGDVFEGAALAATGKSVSQFKRRVLRLLGRNDQAAIRLTTSSMVISMLLILSLFLAPIVWRSAARAEEEPEKTSEEVTLDHDNQPKSMSAEEASRLPGGTISGRVLTADGIPIEGAVVTLPNYGDDPPIGEATTKADGCFSLEPKKPWASGIHRRSSALRIEAEGYAANYVDDRHLTVFSGLDKNLGDIRLDLGRVYTGRVLDSEGDPISGAKVGCGALRFTLGHTAGNIGHEQRVFTDADGRFETPAIPLGSAYVYVLADGYQMGVYYDKVRFSDLGPDGRLPDLMLQPDKPVHGVVTDENGEPVAGVDVRANSTPTKTDAQGRFLLRGFGEEISHFQLQISVEGYAFVNWGVTVTADGLEYHEVGKFADILEHTKPGVEAYEKAREAVTVRTAKLEIRLQREARIRGRAIDAETGSPVAVSRIVRCDFTRKKNGEVVLNGCRSARFTQVSAGAFSVAYSYPTEYHLTISADGYEDAEAFTPAVTTLREVDGIEVKMTKKGDVEKDPSNLRQRILGVVKDGDELLKNARIALWRLPSKPNTENANIIRGRTTVGDGWVLGSTILKDGRFSLNVRYQSDDWYLLVETPKRIVAVHGPISVAKGESKTVEVATRSSGEVRGRVVNGSSVNAPLWAVLFSEVGIQYETPVREDGSFAFTHVYPGEYGLKAGCDSILDTEVPDAFETEMSSEDYLAISQKPSAPWKRATRVTVEEGKITEGLSIIFQP